MQHILVVKLSSLGDVIHTAPALHDIVHACPQAQIDWVVEESLVDLPRMMRGVQRIIPVALRRWRSQGWVTSRTREEFSAFRRSLQQSAYTHVVDFQGLIKSAFIARLAPLAPGGLRAGLANQTEGSSYEPLARWCYDRAVRVPVNVHAIERSRQLAAAVLGYALPPELGYGMTAPAMEAALATTLAPRYVVFVHGSSRADKCWLQHHWVALAQEIAARGLQAVLPWGSAAELLAAKEMAARIGPTALVLPRLPLAQVAAVLDGAAAVVGVDSGLVHMATALGRPTVQLYNYPTAWRTGGYGSARVANVGGEQPPTLAQVSAALRAVMAA
ncbi:MAG: lipopolysaccharide heptosyltransferase I [Betaproteobacteria bacterium]|nr:lipopolysaccharide heptosyltransferase I [Betaproteobacteria bacterium]